MHGNRNLLLLLLFAAIIGTGVLILHDPSAIHADLSLKPPSFMHLGGTDRLGRDVLARAVLGFKRSLIIAGAAEMISLVACLLINLALLLLKQIKLQPLLSTPLLAMRTVPPFLMGLAVASLFGATDWGLILALVLISFPFEVAFIEEEINATMEMPHIEGARAIGLPYRLILERHVGKVAMPRIFQYAILDFVGLVAFEALLGFIGLSRPPAPSIGSEIYNATPYITTYPWLFLVPVLLFAAGLLVINTGFIKLTNRR